LAQDIGAGRKSIMKNIGKAIFTEEPKEVAEAFDQQR